MEEDGKVARLVSELWLWFDQVIGMILGRLATGIGVSCVMLNVIVSINHWHDGIRVFALAQFMRIDEHH